MAKYNYAVYRRAIANELLKESKIIEEISEWTIFSDESTKEYHCFKITGATKDGYKFTFDENKVIESEEAKNIFELLYEVDEDGISENHEKYNKNNITFHMSSIIDLESNKFETYSLKLSEIIKHFKFKAKIPLEKFTYKGFKITTKDNESPKLSLFTNPTSYKPMNICNPKEIQISEESLKNEKDKMKQEKFDITDYDRLVVRSFNDFLDNNFELLEWINENKSFPDCKHEFKPSDGFSDKNKEQRKSELKKNFKENYFEIKCMSEQAFKEKFFPTDNLRKCAYCGVPEEKLNLFETVRAGRGARLEYDRLLSRDENKDKIDYTLDNVALSCYWCNNAKTDTFSPKEFKPIARGINQAWNQKLKDSGSKDHIYFPENSSIWDKE